MSRATVSYVLNQVADSRISPETAMRVREAAGALGYVPHAMARSLRAGRSSLVLMPRVSMPPGPLLDTYGEAIEKRLRELGYTVVVHGDHRIRGVEGARVWASLRPAGVIVETKRLTRAAVQLLRTAGVTAILGLGWSASSLVPTLVSDHAATGRCAAEHLVARGHRRLAVVVPKDPRLVDLGLERLAGFRSVAAAHDLAVERVDVTYDQASAALAVAGWRGAGPVGVFAYNDEYAMLLMRTLLDAGLRVPQDVAVVGADDLPLCELLRPRLTSVHIEAIASARAVAETMHALIGGARSSVGSLRLLESWVVVRESA